MIRKHKRYTHPKKPYEKTRIAEENVLLERYGLKNKKEIWKALAKVRYFRHRAMKLAKSPLEEQEVFFAKLKNLNLKANSISDVLALNVEDILKRRLQSVLVSKGLANTMRQARQLITHKKVCINGRIVNLPSYLVSINEEKNISIKQNKKQKNTSADKNPSEQNPPVEEKDKEVVQNE